MKTQTVQSGGKWRMRIVFKMAHKTIVFKTAEPVDFVMWMQYELHSGTKLIPEWNSFWYHVNSPLIIIQQIVTMPKYQVMFRKIEQDNC